VLYGMLLRLKILHRITSIISQQSWCICAGISGMEKVAAFLETHRYAALVGASMAFAKMEGTTVNAVDKRTYSVMSYIYKSITYGTTDSKYEGRSPVRCTSTCCKAVRPTATETVSATDHGSMGRFIGAGRGHIDKEEQYGNVSYGGAGEVAIGHTGAPQNLLGHSMPKAAAPWRLPPHHQFIKVNRSRFAFFIAGTCGSAGGGSAKACGFRCPARKPPKVPIPLSPGPSSPGLG
jgi:hypothetical protein